MTLVGSQALSLLLSLFFVICKIRIQILAQQISTKCLLCAKHYGRYWKYDGEQDS